MGLILVRYGEIALKGKNRSAFTRQLRRNIRAALKQSNLTGDVFEQGQRMYVRTEPPEAAIQPLQRVFGIVSLSPVVEVERDITAIQQEALCMAQRAGLSANHSFRTETRRADKSFPLISPEVNRLVGRVVQETTGANVDLRQAVDLIIGIEVRPERVLLFGEVFPGMGGLPIPTAGRVIALLSGGIDSPVAMWLLMKRGCGVIPVHFSGSAEETEKVLDQCRMLARYSYGWRIEPIILSHSEALQPRMEKLRAIGAGRWACVICKRTMLERAADLAEELDAQAIVMGDSLGQVASQTLANMEVISFGIHKPILRPLIGMDKVEITALARKIGSFEISTRPAKSCRYLPPNPLTRGTVQELQEILAGLNDA